MNYVILNLDNGLLYNCMSISKKPTSQDAKWLPAYSKNVGFATTLEIADDVAIMLQAFTHVPHVAKSIADPEIQKIING